MVFNLISPLNLYTRTRVHTYTQVWKLYLERNWCNLLYSVRKFVFFIYRRVSDVILFRLLLRTDIADGICGHPHSSIAFEKSATRILFYTHIIHRFYRKCTSQITGVMWLRRHCFENSLQN